MTGAGLRGNVRRIFSYNLSTYDPPSPPTMTNRASETVVDRFLSDSIEVNGSKIVEREPRITRPQEAFNPEMFPRLGGRFLQRNAESCQITGRALGMSWRSARAGSSTAQLTNKPEMMLMLRARITVLKAKERSPCSRARRRMEREVTFTSDTWQVIPMTKEKYAKSW